MKEQEEHRADKEALSSARRVAEELSSELAGLRGEKEVLATARQREARELSDALAAARAEAAAAARQRDAAAARALQAEQEAAARCREAQHDREDLAAERAALVDRVRELHGVVRQKVRDDDSVERGFGVAAGALLGLSRCDVSGDASHMSPRRAPAAHGAAPPPPPRLGAAAPRYDTYRAAPAVPPAASSAPGYGGMQWYPVTEP